MKSGKYIKDRLYSVCIFVAMLIISVLMMAAFKVSVQLIIAEISGFSKRSLITGTHKY